MKLPTLMNVEFNITVLGAPRSGKTSLLSSVYKQFDQVIGNESDLEIKPTSIKDALLEREAIALQSAFSSDTQMPLNNADVVRATSISDEDAKAKNNRQRAAQSQKTFLTSKSSVNDKRLEKKHLDIEYRFNLGQKNQKPKFQLILRDYPGEQLKDNLKEVVNRVRECSVTMIAVDTPALMVESTHSGKTLRSFNGDNSGIVHDIFKEAYANIKDKKLVILAPIKCEKWMKDPASAEQMIARINEHYKCLFELMSSKELGNNVAVVITPVETLGGVIYAYMDDQDTYSPRFIKKGIAAKYDPRYCDQPLRYILRFTLKRFLEKSGFWFNLFGNEKPFLNAINNFTKGCRADSPLGLQANAFMVVQGNNLL